MSSSGDIRLNLFQRIGLELLWGFSRMMHYMPRWFRFGLLQPFIYLLLRLIRYRRGVILNNLRGSFPEKSEGEIRDIMHKFYNVLAEVIVDTISLAGAKPGDKERYLVVENYEEHIAQTKGRDWVAAASHFGCWEYFLLWTWYSESMFMGVYHPLRSAVFECYYRRLRNLSPHIHQVTMKDTMRFYLRNRDTAGGICVGLISDQSPMLRIDTEWYDFLNRKTAFVEGSEKFAKRFKLPVYFCNIRRLRAGQYSVRLELLYDGCEEVEDKEITRRYVKALERMIRTTPELWLWSHNRWKYTPQSQIDWFGKSTLQE